MKSFVESQFGYCPLSWVSHETYINRRTNHIHERSIRTIYKDYNSAFKDLLKKDKSVCINHRNIQFLVPKLFEVKKNLSYTIVSDIFSIRR